MLQQIFHISIVSCICCIWGLPLALATKKDRLAGWTGRSRMGLLSFLCLSGCITLSILSSWLYLLIPLHFSYLSALTILLLLILLLFYRKKIRAVLPDRPKEGAGLPPAVFLLLFLALLLFVLFPRLAGPLWGSPADAGARTGLSDRMRPGAISELSQSDAVAFRVDFFGSPPEARDRYWRGPVFARFNGREWTASFRLQAGRVSTALPNLLDN